MAGAAVGALAVAQAQQGIDREHQASPAHALYCSLTLQDSQDPNPLIRALAVRTMGCIRVDKITEYLCDPLQRCLKVCSS
jgi:vesicle coat complex subunit